MPSISISHPWSFPTLTCILLLVWIFKTSPLPPPNMLLCFHRGEPQIFCEIPVFLSILALSELRFSYFSVEFLQQSSIWTHGLLPYVHDIHSAGVLSWEFRSKHNAPMLKTLPWLPSLYEKNTQTNKLPMICPSYGSSNVRSFLYASYFCQFCWMSNNIIITVFTVAVIFISNSMGI